MFDGITYRKGYQSYRFNNKRIHRVLWEHINGPIEDGMQIHHIDHNPDNNVIENLEKLTQSEHMRHHADASRFGNDVRYVRECTGCGVTFECINGVKNKPNVYCTSKCRSRHVYSQSLKVATA